MWSDKINKTFQLENLECWVLILLRLSESFQQNAGCTVVDSDNKLLIGEVFRDALSIDRDAKFNLDSLSYYSLQVLIASKFIQGDLKLSLTIIARF